MRALEAMGRRTPISSGPTWDHQAFTRLLAAWLAARSGAQLADFTGAARISASQVHRLKQPGVDPGLRMSLRVAQVLGVPIEELVRES